MSTIKIDETTDRFGRPLSPDPEATRVETNPVGVHIVPMTPDRYALADRAAGAGVSWHDRGKWESGHVLQVPVRDDEHARWFVGYQDDRAIVNHGEGRSRTRGRSLYVFQDSSCIAAHPEMGTAADIRRWKAAGQWHEAQVGDLVILQCYDENQETGVVELVETVAARIVPAGHAGSHIDLELVQR